ncbi:MAG: hypothetical protein KJO78_07590, partial [Alphaproteobacteria bacterium]|nr:hypothetical protein [Alphaproteobacteria bacterium]
NQYWAIGISIAGLYFGISIMFGYIPGLESDVGTFQRLAKLAAMGVAEYGYFQTGLGAIVASLAFALLCLFSGKGSPDGGMGLD